MEDGTHSIWIGEQRREWSSRHLWGNDLRCRRYRIVIVTATTPIESYRPPHLSSACSIPAPRASPPECPNGSAPYPAQRLGLALVVFCIALKSGPCVTRCVRLQSLGISSGQQPFDALPVVTCDSQEDQSPDLSLSVLDSGYVALCNTDSRCDVRLLCVKATKLADSAAHDLPIDDDMILQFRR